MQTMPTPPASIIISTKRKKANKTSILELVTLSNHDVEETTEQTTKDGGTF